MPCLDSCIFLNQNFSFKQSPKSGQCLFHLLKTYLLPSSFTKHGLNPLLLPSPHSYILQTSPTPENPACCVHCLLWYLRLVGHSPSPQATLCICHPLLILRKPHSLHTGPTQLWHLPLGGGMPCTLTAERTVRELRTSRAGATLHNPTASQPF